MAYKAKDKAKDLAIGAAKGAAANAVAINRTKRKSIMSRSGGKPREGPIDVGFM